ARQRYCRAIVMSDRMPLKTEETCELGLDNDLKRQCLDNLNAHITSEFGELEKCDALASNNARSICRSTVTALKISNLQDYSICKKLNYAKEINACKDQVIMHRSMHERDPKLCETLSNKRMANACLVNAVIRQKQVEMETRNLLAFDNTAEAAISSDAGLSLDDSAQIAIAKPLPWTEIYSDGNISLAYTKHLDRNAQTGKAFKQLAGTQLGLKATEDFDLTDFMEPFIYGKGVASGDFNNDGWPDLAFASSNGLLLYANKGDGSFGLARHISVDEQALNAFIVTFVDIDNDGWQDLFLTAYASESYFFKNNKGHFSAEDFFHLPKNDTIVTLAAGFADWDRDGDLDIALGNWSYGAEGAFIPEKSQNIWYRNDKLQFRPELPDEPLGETLSLLLSDINSDGYTDLIAGNDRKYPDMFYLGKPNSEFNRVTSDMGLIKETSMNTMSYDSADFNNDLLLDIFSTDMFVAAGINRPYCDSLPLPSDKKRCEWLLQGNKAVESLDVGWCASLKNKDRAACYTAMAIRLAKRDKNDALCDKVSSAFPAKADFCRNIAHKMHTVEFTSYHNHLAQHESNKLLINTTENRFIDATESMGVKNSYWGWTGKAADLDNDGWQDIYIGNGLGFGQHGKNIHSNIFYHNQQGMNFVQAEEKFGLINYTNTPSYTYLDFDLDGDIDIISSDVMSTPSVYVNQGTTGNSVSFVLRDNAGNRFCIGCKIIIRYADSKKNQIRELKLSGGFMSYDDPVAYFGLDEYEHIDSIKIIWSTGETSVLDKPLPANRRYKITRHDSSFIGRINSALQRPEDKP
ncbi:Alkaline phosphatase, partial [hydrothermal vent metagenome]